DPLSLQQTAHLLRTPTHAVGLFEPLRQLSGGPGPVRPGDLGPHRRQHRRRHRRRLPDVGTIRQGVEPSHHAPLDPMSQPTLVLVQVSGDPGNAPARVAQPHHLQAVSRSGHHSGLMGPTAQLLVLLYGQLHSIHRLSLLPSFLPLYSAVLLSTTTTR